MGNLDKEKAVKIDKMRSKVKELLAEIKSIVEQGRLVSKDSSQLFLFKGMFRRLDSYFDSFNEAWNQLTELADVEGVSPAFPSDAEKHFPANVKRYYYEASAIYEAHMNPTPVAQRSVNANDTGMETALRDHNDSRTVRARLPQINLPVFSGAQEEWPLFRDTYLSLIHDEGTLSNIEKFHFLLSCLRGPALSLVRNVPLQEANYEQAWKALKENYDDKRRLANNYLKTILNYVPFRNKPTANGLKHFLTTVLESVSAFKQLNLDNADDFILIYLILRCLDPATRREFEKEVSSVEFPTVDALKKFLRSEWKSLELTQEESRVPSSKQGVFSSKSLNSKKPETTLFVDNECVASPSQPDSLPASRRSDSRSSECPVCESKHSLYNCSNFKSSSAEEKRRMLKKWKGCTNCLSSKHKVDNCSSPRRCQICNGKHHSWLHLPSSSGAMCPNTNLTETAALSGTFQGSEVILGTALARIKDSRGQFQTIRLVTDCGSQQSFITKRCLDRLGLTVSPTDKTIAGIGRVQLPQSYGTLACTLRPRYSDEEFCTTALAVPEITGHLPHSRIPQEIHVRLGAFELADPTYWKPQEIEFLLGADLYYDLITGAPFTLQEDCPKLIPSKLGHIVAGRCGTTLQNQGQTTSLFVQTRDNLATIMSQFWEIESLPRRSLLTDEERACEEHYVNTHYRLPSGRYVVGLPFKPSIKELENPQNQATSRFLNLEHKLKHRPTLRNEYADFMLEYEQLGHMQPAQNQTRYLIPHHAICKKENGKDKLRVVFDASCRGPKGSLNDHLQVGPKLQRDISEIVTSFRTHAVAVVADIVKMYRQILVRPEDRPYQHILWRSDPKDELRTMELTTVTYGENVSPFLALRTLLQLVNDEGENYPMAAKVIEKCSYMDDFVAGAATIEEALQLKEELIQLLRLGGFELSKWKSNCSEVLRKDHDGNTDEQLSFIDEKENTYKILGLKWVSSTDVFTFQVEKPTAPYTKRGILSTIARIYDPLGYLAPVVFKAKTILQDVWLATCDWDDHVPKNIAEAWESFADQLPQLSNVELRRFIGLTDSVSYDLIGFSDASQRGYAAAIYLRVSSRDTTNIHLIKAKTKLAPTKLTSIPRLELCGALLLANLLDSCKWPLQSLNIQNILLFTDSTIVLGWINLPLNRLKAFVAHRVAAILEITSAESWHHVPSECNPADCASRGLMPQEIKSCHLWWSGPDWLRQPQEDWPLSVTDHTQHELPETTPTGSIVVLITEDFQSIVNWMLNSNSYIKILNSMGIALRFIKRLRRDAQSSECNALTEREKAKMVCIRLIQEDYLSTNKDIGTSRQWLSLAPFKDSHGVFRVGGRLENSSLPFNTKHPIILPDSHFTRVLIDYYHRIFLHIGPNSLQAALQRRYYIISGRRLIRSRVRQCVTCQLSAPRPQAPMMGNLPPFRLDEGQIFQHVGMDLGGPFPIKESQRRKAGLGKSYLCLFVCMVTKAVHLEVVTSCSTEAFIAALHRFVARRGKPRHIYSDCGTNFVGASAELKRLYLWYNDETTQNRITDAASIIEIQWHFNPPCSPHFGGIWEAGIKSAKTLLSKNLGNTPLTYEELSTIFCRIEAVMNSRPLAPMNNDTSSFEYLTPGHFLIGRPLTAPPEESLLDEKENRLNRWQLVQQRVQHFWKQWRSSYLNQLQQRQKWITPRCNLNEGDLVILKESNNLPTKWPIGRVVSTHPGQDGIVRVVTIRTPTGTYKRPVIKLVPLVLPQ